jgi:hypothetical protein
LPGNRPIRRLRAWLSRGPSQGETLDELNRSLAEVIEMLLEDGEPDLESLFVGTQTVQVA